MEVDSVTDFFCIAVFCFFTNLHFLPIAKIKFIPKVFYYTGIRLRKVRN